jgi:probable HAF family extracellular repeat protein
MTLERFPARVLVPVLLGLPLAAVVGGFARAQATFTVLGDIPGGTHYAEVRAVSADGTTAVGTSEGATPGWPAMECFVWKAATGLVGQGDLPGGAWGSFGAGVTGDGASFVGYGYAPAGNEAHRNMLPIPMYPAGGFDARATGISDGGGTVCGWSFLPTGGSEGWTWTGTVMPPTGIGDLAGGSFYSLALAISGDGHVVVGESESASGVEAFRKDLTTGAMIGLGDLAGGAFDSQANGASFDGSVIVGESVTTASGEASPFRWTSGGGMVALTGLVGTAKACSADGSIVVGRTGFGAITHAFVWDAAHGVRDLYDVLVADYGLGAALAGWTLYEAIDVSNDGTVIVGHGLSPGGTWEAWIVDLGSGPVSPMASFCHPGESGVIACPCANPPGASGRGCENSSHSGGAQLAATGVASLAADTLVFTTTREKPTALTILLQGPGITATGVAFGQGVRCVSGGLKRLYVKTASAGSITAPGPGDLSVHARSAAAGDPIAPGTDRHYFAFYRDPIVLGGCPATSTFNATQAGSVGWAP